MTERDVTEKSHEYIKRACPSVKSYKHNDRSTEGMPDSSHTFDGHTTWIEYKLLEPTEPLHAKPGSTSGLKKLQLMELIALERESQGRAWVVAYRKGKRGQEPRVEVYRPSALIKHGGPELHRVQPVAVDMSRSVIDGGAMLSDGSISSTVVFWTLQRHGAVQFTGHNHWVGAILVRGL